MPKGEQRGNREVRKPKKEKPKAAPPASPFAPKDKSGTPARSPGGKK